MACLSLTNHFLIAMPTMEDPYFAKSLVFVAEHNDEGALGVIVNRPIDMNLATLFRKIDVPLGEGALGDLPVLFGGPVQTDRGFVLHRPLGTWQSTLVVSQDIGLTTSRDVLQSLGLVGSPDDMVVTLGYSGWGAGQLEHELTQNAWLTVPADPRILFELPHEQKLASALHLLGIDPANLSRHAGHA